MNEADRNNYFVSAVAWLLGGCWQFAAAPSLVSDTIGGVPALVDASQAIRTMTLAHQVVAAMIAFGCFACIMLLRSSEQKPGAQPPLKRFFVRTRKPLHLAGIAGSVVSFLLFCTSEGLDYRHAYVLGVAAAGILVMALVAIAALAFFKIENPVKKKKPRPGKARFPLFPCLVQSVGCYWVGAILGSIIGALFSLAGR